MNNKEIVNKRLRLVIEELTDAGVRRDFCDMELFIKLTEMYFKSRDITFTQYHSHAEDNVSIIHTKVIYQLNENEKHDDEYIFKFENTNHSDNEIYINEAKDYAYINVVGLLDHKPNTIFPKINFIDLD